MNSPRVSVVIPVYCASEQHELFLEEALNSVASQTFRSFEVVIVDDKSPRDISPVLTRISGLPKVTVIHNEVNQRQAESRNIGVRASIGELIAFLDHDDLWAPEKLERQVEHFIATLDAGIVCCAVQTIGPFAHRINIDQSIIPTNPDYMWLINHGNYLITASAILARRQAIFDAGLFDPRYSTCDDFDLWLKIVRKQLIVFLPEQLASYRLHSMNANYGVDRLNDNRLLTVALLDYWKTAPFAHKMRLLPRIARKLLGRAYFSVWRYRHFQD